MTKSSAGSRGLRRIVITVLVLVIVLLVGDRVSDYVAEQVTASTIQDSQDLPAEPDVDVGGFPFLTQLAAGDFDQITVTADDVPVGTDDINLTFSRIRVVLDHVTVARDFSRVHAESANAVGTVSYAELSDTLGVDLSYAGQGKVRAKKSISLLGQTVTPSITAEPIFVKGALGFGEAQVNGLGALAGDVSQVLDKVFDVKAPLDGIPFEIRVQKLSVNESGLRVDLTGADLTYEK